MRIGIFNRWLQTQGGGERQTGAAAQALAADGHEVTFISTNPTDLSALAHRLNLDLANVALRVIPDLPYSEIAALTAEYDLFINGSHMDAIPNRAPASILFIYFPRPRDLAPLARLTLHVVKQCAALLGRVRYEYGFYGMELVDVGWYRAMSGRAGFSVPGGRRGVTVQLAIGNFAAAVPLRVRFSCQGAVLTETDVAPSGGNFRLLTLQVPATLSQAERMHVDVESEVAEPDPATPAERRPLGIAISQVTAGTAFSRFFRRLVERNLPRLLLRTRTLLEETETGYLHTYDRILANSAFTAGWLRRYWGADSDVLYPPVDITSFAPEAKQPIIFSIGRFFVGGHSKRQDVLVEAFRTLVATGVQDLATPPSRQRRTDSGRPCVLCQGSGNSTGLTYNLSCQCGLCNPAGTLRSGEPLLARSRLWCKRTEGAKSPRALWHQCSRGHGRRRGANSSRQGRLERDHHAGRNRHPLGHAGRTRLRHTTTHRETLDDARSSSTAAQERSKAFSQQRYGSAMQQIVRRLAVKDPQS